MTRAGVDYRQALPPEKWPAMALFLKTLAARRECGRLSVGEFLRRYRLDGVKSRGAGAGEGRGLGD